MSESELSTYQLQLQQVEAALTSDPANSELLKLKTDLEQVINLTKTLIEQQVAKSNEDEEEEETGDFLTLTDDMRFLTFLISFNTPFRS